MNWQYYLQAQLDMGITTGDMLQIAGEMTHCHWFRGILDILEHVKMINGNLVFIN